MGSHRGEWSDRWRERDPVLTPASKSPNQTYPRTPQVSEMTNLSRVSCNSQTGVPRLVELQRPASATDLICVCVCSPRAEGKSKGEGGGQGRRT